jgi:hypothetical protein
MNRRAFLGTGSWLSLSVVLPLTAWARAKYDAGRAKAGYLDRLHKIKSSGVIPIIDIESSYDAQSIDLDEFVKSMDSAGVALICMSVDQKGNLVKKGQIWNDHALDAFQRFPAHFIPTGNGGNHPAWTTPELRSIFLAENHKHIVEDGYPLMGEFEVRHYPSPRQIRRGDLFRDVDIPINGPDMESVFAFSERSGVPFQIHYEIEDGLLGPLGQMLTRYPKAKVIWCHMAQIRYQARSSTYSPAFLEDWLERHQNLYLDIAFGDRTSIYGGSNERHARFWNNPQQWASLIDKYPTRFLAALDIGGDRMNEVETKTKTLRQVLDFLSPTARDWVAYKSAWRLLFNEELTL